MLQLNCYAFKQYTLITILAVALSACQSGSGPGACIDISGGSISPTTTSRSIVVNRDFSQTGSTTLSWTAPTERTDGSPLTNLAGYKIYYGRMSGICDYQININNPGISTYVVEYLVSGDWYFALTAYDSEGLESNRSNEVLKVIS